MRKSGFSAAMLLAAAVALGPGVSEAKRIGAKPKSSATPAKKADEEDAVKSSGTTFSPRLRMPVAAGTGAAAGVAAGAAAASVPPSAAEPEAADQEALAAIDEQKRQEKLSELERNVQIEEAAGKAEQAVAAQKLRAAQLETERLVREQEAEARRRAEEDRQAAARAKAIERDRSCVIRPVMSDAEIDRCKWAWSVPPPG